MTTATGAVKVEVVEMPEGHRRIRMTFGDTAHADMSAKDAAMIADDLREAVDWMEARA